MNNTSLKLVSVSNTSLNNKTITCMSELKVKGKTWAEARTTAKNAMWKQREGNGGTLCSWLDGVQCYTYVVQLT